MSCLASLLRSRRAAGEMEAEHSGTSVSDQEFVSETHQLFGVG